VNKRVRNGNAAFVLGIALGTIAVCLSGAFLTVVLALGGKPFLSVAAAIVVAHVPVMIADGLVTGAALVFVLKVSPGLLGQFPVVKKI